MIFGACCVFFLVSSLLILRVVDALAAGPEDWAKLLRELHHPLYLAYNVIALAGFLFTGRRFLFQLFAKSQPPRIGPLPRPPLSLFPPLFGAAWLGATALIVCILWGVFP
jgi:fumarate reductase subunit C